MNKRNEEYVESLQQAFDEALEEGNIQECRAIIEVLKRNSFDVEAQSLLDDLYNAPLDKFSHPSTLI